MTSHKRRSHTMKQTRDKIRPKNKGKKKSKPGDRNSQNLPLLNKLIYIDIKQGKQCELIEEQLKKLGARVEKFLSCEVNYVISLTGPLKTEKINAKDENPQSPSFVNMTSPFNCGPSPTGNNEIKKAVVSRGKALAQIACAKNQASSVVANAEKLGIKIISLDAASKWLEKELKKLDKECQKDAFKNEDKTCPFNSQTHESKKRKKQLKGSFIKFEAVNKLYRPVKSEFPTWPKINLMAPPGICPFGEARLKVQHHYRTRKCLPTSTLPPRSEQVSGNGMDTVEPKAKETRTTKNVKASVSAVPELVGVPIVTAGEVKGNLAVHLKKAIQMNKQQGYCDCCEIKYTDLDEHLTSYEHRAFIRDKSNFESLDALINKVPSTVQFLQSVLLKHCVQKQDVNGSSENSVGNFMSVVSPISPLTTERTVNPSLETVATSLIVPQELKDENLPSKNKQAADDTESHTMTKNENDDNRFSAVVIRRPTPSGIFTSPRRRQPTPSKKPWVQERSMVFRDSPMASLQPSINSSPSITLAESVCLGAARCFSAPALNKKQELKKSASRSLIRVIDFTQMTSIGSSKTEITIEPPSVQFKTLSAGEVKKKLIGNSVNIMQNKRKSHKLRKREDEIVRNNIYHEDIIQDFHFLTLSTDEKSAIVHLKDTIEKEANANNNSFSSEHLKDTIENEANADNNFLSEHLKDTIDLKDTIEKEANANNSFSFEYLKDTIENEANADNKSFSSAHLIDTIIKEGNADNKSFSTAHLIDTIEKEANADNKSFPSAHLIDTIVKETNASNSFSSEHLKGTIEKEALADNNSLSFEHIESNTNSVLNAGKKIKCSLQTRVQTEENIDNLLAKKQNTVFNIMCERGKDAILPEEKLSNEITLNKEIKSQLTLPEKNKSLHSSTDLVEERSRKKSGGSKSIADTSSFVSCRKSLESESELTLHSANKTFNVFSQEEKGCKLQMLEGDCLSNISQNRNQVFNEKSKGICSFEQICNSLSSPINFNCVVNLGAQLGNNLINVNYQNQSNLKLPSLKQEMHKERCIKSEYKEHAPKHCRPENSVENLSEEETICDYSGNQDDCEINNSSMSVPNLADRVKTRHRVGQPVDQCEDEDGNSPLKSQDKRKKRNQKSLEKVIDKSTNDKSAYSGCNNTFKTSEQHADLALPAFPNIAERVKKRRSCTLFNHEGQYANNSGVILSPEILQLHTDYTHKTHQKMSSTSSGKNGFRRKLIFSGNKNTFNVNEESKMSSYCTQSSPAVVIRRRNPLSCRVRTNKDWSKHEPDKDNQTTSDSDKINDNKRDGCDKQANLAPRSENSAVKCFKKKPTNQDVCNESTKKRDQIKASENSMKMGTISNSPRLLLKIKRQTKNTFSSTLEEIDCSSSLYSQFNQAGSSQRPETPQPIHRANCLDSDSESVKILNSTPTPRKTNIYRNLNASHEKPRRYKKRKRLNFEELSERSVTSLERPKSPIFSSPVVQNSSLASNEIEKYFTRVDSPIFFKKQSSKTLLNGIDKSIVYLKADLKATTLKEDFKEIIDADENAVEYAQAEDFSSDATYIYDVEGFEVIEVEKFDDQIMANSSHEITGYNNDYTDFLTFIPKLNSPEKVEVSSWGEICESYVNNSIVMTVANSGARVIKDTITMSPLKFQSDSKKGTIKNVNKSVMSGSRGKRRLSEVNSFDETCQKKVKI